MKNHNRSCFWSLLMVLALLLSACGGAATPTNASQVDAPAPAEPAATQPAAAGGEPVTIRFWSHQNDAFNSAYKALAQKYMAEHSNITIQFEDFEYEAYLQTLQTSLPAGTQADILQMFGSWVCSYAEGGNLAETPANVITLDDARSKLFEAPIGGYICNDKLYGIPQEFNVEYGAALVNTALTDEAGVSSEGWEDWDAFIAEAKQLSVFEDGVMTRAGFNFTGSDGISAMFYSLILQNGGQYLDGDVFTVNTEAGRKTLELMKRFVDEGLIDPLLFNDEQNWVGDSFFEETSAIGLVGPWVVPEYGVDYPEVAEIVKYEQLPYTSETPIFAAASGWGLTVSANSKAQDAAWDFIKYVTLNPENAVQFNLASGTLPALVENASGKSQSALIKEFHYFGPWLQILEYGEYEGQFPDRDFVWYEVTYPRVLNFLQGNATLEDTLKSIESDVQGSF